MKKRATFLKCKDESGFALVTTAIGIVLILIATTLSMRGMFGAYMAGDSISQTVGSQVMKTFLKSASAYASKTGNPTDAEAYIKKCLQQLTIFDLELPVPSGEGSMASKETALRIVRLYHSSDENAGETIEVTGLPMGSFVALASPDTRERGLVAYAGPALDGEPLEISLPRKLEGGCMIVYPARDSVTYRFPASGTGTLSNAYYYTVPSTGSPAMTACAWTPPAGESAFPYIRVVGVPPLGLVVVSDALGAPVGVSLAHGFVYAGTSSEVLVYVPGMPLSGSVTVITPAAWVIGDFEGGDQYTYVRTGR